MHVYVYIFTAWKLIKSVDQNECPKVLMLCCLWLIHGPHLGALTLLVTRMLRCKPPPVQYSRTFHHITLNPQQPTTRKPPNTSHDATENRRRLHDASTGYPWNAPAVPGSTAASVVSSAPI